MDIKRYDFDYRIAEVMPMLEEKQLYGTKALIRDLKTVVDEIQEIRAKAIDIVNQFTAEYLNCAADGWIPCSERLPETNEGVLVCTNEGQVDVDYYGEYTKDFIGLKGTEQYAIAWQPLPAPYKEGE